MPWSPAHGQGEEDHALSMGQKSVSLFQWLLLNHSPKRGKKRNWKQTWQNSRNLPPPAPQTHTQMKAHIVYMGMGRRRPETPWCQEAIELHGAWISNHVLSTSWDFPAVFYVPHLQHLFSSTWHLGQFHILVFFLSVVGWACAASCQGKNHANCFWMSSRYSQQLQVLLQAFL